MRDSDGFRSIDEASLRADVEHLAGIGPRSIYDPHAVSRALTWSSDRLRAAGYRVEEEPFGVEPHRRNLLAELPGVDRPNEILELGAHIDTVPGSPGADDNASGVAGVLAIARSLRSLSPRRTVRFCLFGEEESGLAGSTHHARCVRADARRRVEGIVVFEMIGFRASAPGSQRTPVRIPLVIWPPRTGDFLCVVSNVASRGLATRFERAAKRAVPELGLYVIRWLGGLIPDGSRSDHLPYWRTGQRGIMLTDTANFRNPHYHCPSDTPDTLDYGFLAAVVRATAAMLADWAMDEQ